MKIKELLVEPKCWAQGSYAYDSEGCDVYWNSPEAQCWCLRGAVHRCYGCDEQLEVFRKLERGIAALLGQDPNLAFISILDWNDKKGRTHEEVLKLVTELDV